jgi:hypothetical protein
MAEEAVRHTRRRYFAKDVAEVVRGSTEAQALIMSTPELPHQSES